MYFWLVYGFKIFIIQRTGYAAEMRNCMFIFEIGELCDHFAEIESIISLSIWH